MSNTISCSTMGCDIYAKPCSLCGGRKSGVVAVCIQDNYNVLNNIRELKHIFIKHNPYSYLLMCQICLMKLRLFVKCDGPDFTQDFYHRMQDYPHIKDTSASTKDEDCQHIEDTSCQCEHCKAKFGNLPLLAEVVEKIDKRNSPVRISSSSSSISTAVRETASSVNVLKSKIVSSDAVEEPENLSLRKNNKPRNTSGSVDETVRTSEENSVPETVTHNLHSSPVVPSSRHSPYRRSNVPKESSVSPPIKRVDSPVDLCLLPESIRDVQSPENVPSTSTGRTEPVIHRRVMNCEHCGKCFTHKGDLNKHLRKHTGEQPFECPVCQRKFAHTSNLARHLRVHSGDKPFHCDRCDKSFSRKDKLIMHQKTKLCINAATSSKS